MKILSKLSNSNNRLLDLNDQVMESIGYRPLSNRIKPVHIANGLFRAILQEEYILKDLNIWAKRFKLGKEIYSAEFIQENYPDILDEDMTTEQINDLRAFIEMLIDADKAVTPEVKFTTLTIPSKSFVGHEVQNEFKLPEFIHKILNSEVNGEISPVINVVKDLLSDESDEISKFMGPITRNIHSKQKKTNNFSFENLSGIELEIRKGFDLLTSNSLNKTNKLAFLERIITFACFSILYHLSSKILDLTKSYSHIPIIFDANNGDETMKTASRESLLLVRLNIENYYEKVLEGILKKNPLLNSKEAVISHINQFSFAEKKRKGTASVKELNPHEEFTNLFKGFFHQTNNLYESYARAIRIIIFSRAINSSDPSVSYISLAAKIGLVFGRTKSRYVPTPEILEIILLSVLKPDEFLTLSEFGERIWEKYGIIIGANPNEDFQHLKQWKISEHIPGDIHSSLASNADYFAEVFISMGYAKRFADGVIILSL